MRRVAIALTLLTVACAWAVELDNADFEGTARTMPEGWTAQGEAGSVFSVDDADGVGDQSCLRYRSEATVTESFLDQPLTLQPQTEYVLSAWLKSDGTTRPLVAVRETGARDFTARVSSDGGTSWLRQSVRFNSGQITDATMLVYGDFASGRTSRPGTACVDDIRLMLASEAADEGMTIAGGFAGPPPGENIALGKSYTLSQAPNYSLTLDDGDSSQLTDGLHTVGYFWAQKSSVGWKLRAPLQITIDLEQVEPITGVSFNTAAGTAGVGWPSMIFVLASDDGENFTYHGELVGLSAEHGLPTPQEYVVHRYATDRLQAAGRYVRLVVCPGAQYLFSDEIEVYRGDFPVAQARPGDPVESVEQVMESYRLDGIVGVRQMYDIQDLRSRIERAEIDAALKQDLNARLDALADEVRAQHVEEVEHWRGLPYNDLHARIYAVNAPLLRALGHDELTVWPADRWANLDPMVAPEPGEVEINVLKMPNEYRSAAFNITNPTDEPVTARIIGGPQVHEVQYVQTQEREIVANALPVAPTDDAGASLIEVPAGLTKQVWLTFGAPGARAAADAIEVSADGESIAEIDVNEEITDFEMPRPPLNLFAWDYVGDKVTYAPDFTDLDAMADDLEAHFVDAPWAHPGTLPWPADGAIDAEGHITQPLDFGPLDRWIARFPTARLYLLFGSFGSGNFRGTTRGTDQWATALGEWATLLADRLREQGVSPERWAILIIDEPHTEQMEQVVIDVARAMKAAVPELQVFEDPVRPNPAEALPALYEVSDILCPNLGRLNTGGQRAADFYQALQAQGKELFIYQCSGPHKLLDPIAYHRLQSWSAWDLGATGSGYWGYVDAARTGSSWDNFKCGGTSYSMVYVDDENRLVTSKQWEAVREGVEDYTIMWMLRGAIEAHEGEDTEAVRNARELLQTLPGQIANEWEAGGARWPTERDRAAIDAARDRLLRALIEIGPAR
jgi:hypothetical protein